MWRTETRGNSLSPNEQSAAGSGRIAERNQCRNHGRHHQSIDAVKQAAMAGDELA
jgi:hypothetical protein